MKKQLGGAAGFRKGWLLLLLLSLAFILPTFSAEAFQRGEIFKTGFGRGGALAGLLSRVDGKIAELRGERAPGGLRPTTSIKEASGVRLEAGYGRFPLLFEENGGQTAPEVAFTVKGRDKTLYFTPEGLTFSLAMPREAEGKTSRGESPALRKLSSRYEGWVKPEESPRERWTLKLDFVGAGRVRPEGKKPAETVVSYFKGPEREHHPGVPAWNSIVYRDLWPGIDLVYDGDASHLKYRFVVRPGADPERIRLAWRGAERIEVNGDGGLEIVTAAGVLRDDAPLSWQETGEGRVPVKVSYALGRSDAVGSGPDTPLDYGFSVDGYDPARELVIDPVVLVYCGFIGGSREDSGYGIAVDGYGNAYVTGYTESGDFPVAAGPDVSYNGGADAFVAKVNAAGTRLVYCGYIGGSGYDHGLGIAVDVEGSAYVTGGTWSGDFPVVAGPGQTYNGGFHDAFVAKVSASGRRLVYCGYIGGSGDDYGTGIAVDRSGCAYVTGYTESRDFPVKVGPDLAYNGAGDAFVAMVSADGTGLVFCGYIGGSGYDDGTGIALDSPGNVYVTGWTQSDEKTFPVKVGPDLTHNGYRDAFVAKINSAGTGLVYCGYIGGSRDDHSWGIAVDGSGCAYVTGQTLSGETTFPVKVGPDVSHNGGVDAFVAKVSAAGTGLVYCGYIGGSGDDYGLGIAVDGSGNAYVAGFTESGDLPVAAGPGLTFNGNYDAFVAKVSAAGTGLAYCGYIGGSGYDSGNGIALDGSGNAYVTGHTESRETTFPVKAGPDVSHNGGADAFVAKIAVKSPPIPSPGSGGCSALGSGAYALLLALPLAALAFGRK